MDGPADVELDPAAGEVGDDVAGVGQGPGEPVELRNDQDVALAARRERFVEAMAGSEVQRYRILR